MEIFSKDNSKMKKKMDLELLNRLVEEFTKASTRMVKEMASVFISLPIKTKLGGTYMRIIVY